MWFKSECRNCGHLHNHSLSLKYLGMGKCCRNDIKCLCKAKEYIPLDNLEFIESKLGLGK
jgi:hypothetical protein